MGLWERFDDIANADEVKEAKFENTPLQAGTYTMTLQEIKAAESKNGLPMIKGVFRLDNNRPVYYNQMLQNLNYPDLTAKNIAEALNFISGLIGEEIDYNGLSDLERIIDGIEAGLVASINVTYGKKDYEQKFPILKVEGLVDNGEMPF